MRKRLSKCAMKGFNTQPPEGGWAIEKAKSDQIISVSTHSRPKAAGDGLYNPMW